MTYECVCEPFEGKPCDIIKHRVVVARKQHKCCECRDTIKVGERHHVLFIKSDGEVEQFRTCAFCSAERERLASAHTDIPPVYGELACWLVAELRGEL